MNKPLTSLMLVAISAPFLFAAVSDLKLNESSDAGVFFSNTTVYSLPKFAQEVVQQSNCDQKNNCDSINNADFPNSVLYTVDWLRKTIQSKWIPADIADRLIGLRTSLNGEDAFWVQYQIDNCSIQIVSNFGSIFLLIKKSPLCATSDDHLSLDQMDSDLKRVIGDYLQSSEKIFARQVVIQQKGRLIARDPLAKGLHDGCTNCWWEMTRCWTDGESCLIVIPKADPHSPLSQPQSNPDWFDDWQ